MTRKEMMLYIAAMLETLAEGKGSAPSGVLYLAFQTVMTLDDYQYLVQTAREVGLITLSNHVLEITEIGRDVVANIAAAKTGMPK